MSNRKRVWSGGRVFFSDGNDSDRFCCCSWWWLLGSSLDGIVKHIEAMRFLSQSRIQYNDEVRNARFTIKKTNLQWPTTKNRNCSTLLSIAHMPRFWFESHPAVSSQGLLAWFTSLLLPKKRYMMMSTFIATRSISTPERSLQNKQLRCSLRMQLTQWKLADVWRLGHCSGSGGTWQQLTTWALAWHSNERRETHE